MNRPIAALAVLAWLAASCSQQQEAAEPNPAAQEAASSSEGAAKAAPPVTPSPVGTPVPVMAGGEAQLDACATAAVVSGLDPAGDNYLAVRAGPGTGYAETDRLSESQAISVCDGDGHWLGVVYTKDDADCGLASPATARAQYSGPCRSGWVAARFVTVTAG